MHFILNIFLGKINEYLYTGNYLSCVMSECDSSNHPVSGVVFVVVVVVIVASVNFFSFLTSSFKPLHGFASNFVWMFLG